MARTSDPHAATVKSWQTRARAASSGGVVQQRGDFVRESADGGTKAERWDEARTGVPITLNGYRGEGGHGELEPEQQARFGRKYLLGEGTYVAPTRALASAFGEPREVSITLQNPYVLSGVAGADLRSLDLAAIKAAGHDGIIITRGRWGFGRGQEDLKQAVVFDRKQMNTGHAKPAGLAKGVEVKVERVHDAPFGGPNFRADAKAATGKTGRVTSVSAWGHPSVRIGAKVIDFNADEVTIMSEKASEHG